MGNITKTISKEKFKLIKNLISNEINRFQHTYDTDNEEYKLLTEIKFNDNWE